MTSASKCCLALLLGIGLSYAGAARADVILNIQFPFGPDVVPQPCTGELVTVTGTAHAVSSVTVSDSGHVYAKQQFNGAMQGVGQTTGAKYTGGFQEMMSLNFDSFDGCPYVADLTVHSRLNTKGGKNNFFIDGTVHATVNANCELESFHFQPDTATCK